MEVSLGHVLDEGMGCSEPGRCREVSVGGIKGLEQGCNIPKAVRVEDPAGVDGTSFSKICGEGRYEENREVLWCDSGFTVTGGDDAEASQSFGV